MYDSVARQSLKQRIGDHAVAARAAGVSVRDLRSWLAGEHVPHSSHRQALKLLYGIEPDDWAESTVVSDEPSSDSRSVLERVLAMKARNKPAAHAAKVVTHPVVIEPTTDDVQSPAHRMRSNRLELEAMLVDLMARAAVADPSMRVKLDEQIVSCRRLLAQIHRDEAKALQQALTHPDWMDLRAEIAAVIHPCDSCREAVKALLAERIAAHDRKAVGT